MRKKILEFRIWWLGVRISRIDRRRIRLSERLVKLYKRLEELLSNT